MTPESITALVERLRKLPSYNGAGAAGPMREALIDAADALSSLAPVSSGAMPGVETIARVIYGGAFMCAYEDRPIRPDGTPLGNWAASLNVATAIHALFSEAFALAANREHNAHLAVKEERKIADAAEVRATAAEAELREVRMQALADEGQLREALEASQPIDSAPADRPILAFNVMTGWYRTNKTADGLFPFSCWDGTPGTWYPQPTHWRELPAGPSLVRSKAP